MFFDKVRSNLLKFPGDKSGNIAVMASLTIMAILATAGAAVDYARIAHSTSGGQ